MSDNDSSPFVIDELPAARWEDVEAAVFAELEAATPTKAPTRSRVWAFAGVAAVSAAAAAVVVLGFGEWASPDAAPIPTTSSTRFQAGPQGAELALADVNLDIGANARGLAIGDSERGWVVALEAGRVEFAVAPRRDRPSFVVQAADVRVEVVGTRFSVNREADRVDVDVVEGVVRVSAKGRVTELRAGERWATHEETATDVEPTALVLHAAEEPTVQGLSDAQLYDRAAGLEARNPAAAVRIYRRLARGRGAWAETALFACGRLEIETGSMEAGNRSLRRYLQRYPRGINAQDAHSLLDQE